MCCKLKRRSRGAARRQTVDQVEDVRAHLGCGTHVTRALIACRALARSSGRDPEKNATSSASS